MSAKPRSDSVLKNLPEDRQEQIIEWASTPKSDSCPGGLKHAREQLAADGLVVSIRALSEFCAWYRLQSSFSGAENFARSVEERLRQQKGLTAEAISAAGQIAFTAAAVSAQDPEEFRAMEALRLAKETALTRGRQKDQEIKLAERRVRVMEKKIADAQKTLGDSKLSDADKAQRLRQIFKRS